MLLVPLVVTLPFPVNSSMLDTLVKKFVGSKNDREVKKIKPIVEQISALEPQISNLPNEALQVKTAEFKQRLQNRFGKLWKMIFKSNPMNRQICQNAY